MRVSDFGTSCYYGAEASSGTESPRTSFVGTQDYVSPEVLSGETKATKAADLWAVGCMVYQMLTGISPFRRATEYLTFEAISGHCKGTNPLQYPPAIDERAENLVKALLMKDENRRLGASETNEEGGNGYLALKSNIFFEGLQWGHLAELEPCYVPDASQFPSSECMRDGAQDDWWFEGEATPIMSKHHYDFYADGDDEVEEEEDVDDIMELISKASITVVKKRGSASSKFDRFLRAGEKRIYTGLIYKRKVSSNCWWAQVAQARIYHVSFICCCILLRLL